MRRILLLGKNGQLGWELRRTLTTLGQVLSFDYPEINFFDPSSLRNLVSEHRPEIIINAVAYTYVDEAENERDVANIINGTSVGALAEAAREIKAPFFHYSTDYVFDGKKGAPYLETDITEPINSYGRSKLLGEKLIEQAAESFLTIRTSWMYSARRENYVKKVIEWARKSTTLRIVTDHIGSPTWSRMLAEITAQILTLGSKDFYQYFRQYNGIYHLAGQGAVSRYEFAESILRYYSHSEKLKVKELQRALSDEFPMPALRPAYSALDCQKASRTFGLELPAWEDTLKLFMEEIDLEL